MREVTQYIADDGTIFHNENECRQYEVDLVLKDSKFQMFDANFAPLPTNKESGYYRSAYLIAPTEEAAKQAERGFRHFEYEYPDYQGDDPVPGIFCYEGGIWYNVEREYQHWKDILERCQSV